MSMRVRTVLKTLFVVTGVISWILIFIVGGMSGFYIWMNRPQTVDYEENDRFEAEVILYPGGATVLSRYSVKGRVKGGEQQLLITGTAGDTCTLEFVDTSTVAVLLYRRSYTHPVKWIAVDTLLFDLSSEVTPINLR